MEQVQRSSRAITVRELNAASRDWLAAFMESNPMPEGDEGLAIFWRDNNTGVFFFVEDALVPFQKSGAFAKNAPKDLYRGGACGVIRTTHGMLAVSDERRSWYKPFPAGLANHAGGMGLGETFKREFWEEVWAFDHLKRSAHYVPFGGRPKLHCEGLDVTVKETKMAGTLNVLGHYANNLENCLEFHAEWDIRGVEPLSVYYDEDWFLGGRVGIPVVAIDSKGTVVGWYAGQQGFVKPTPDWQLHPTVRTHMSRAAIR